MHNLPNPFQSTTSNRACCSGRGGSFPGFPGSLPRAGLSHPGKNIFIGHLVTASGPLLSLSESVSIAGNPGRSTSRQFAPSPAEISQRAGLPSLQGKQTGLWAPRGWGWAGLGRRGTWGRGAGSQLAHSGPALHPPPPLLPTPSAFPARSGLDCRGDQHLPLSSGGCSWLKPPCCSAGPQQFHSSPPWEPGCLLEQVGSCHCPAPHRP